MKLFRLLLFSLITWTSLFGWMSWAKSPTKIRLALNWKPEPQFGGFYAAEINQEFKKRNLEVEILPGGSGTPTIQMLANNKIEYAIVSGDEILLSLDRNPKNKVIPLFATYQESPAMIMSHKERGFKNLKELFSSPGVLALQSGLPYYNFLLKKYGPQFEVQIVPYLGGIASFLQDKRFSQQGFVTSEALLAQQKGAPVSTFLIADEGFNPYTTVLAVNGDYAQQNPQEVSRMVQAVRAGWQAYLKDPESANKFMHTLNSGLDLELFQKSALAQKPLIESSETQKHGLGWMTEERWGQLSRQMKELGLIKTTPAIDLTLQNK